jgi:RNase P subunit RPR2
MLVAMGIALGVAVVAAVAWLLLLVGRHVIGIDRRARLAATARDAEDRLAALDRSRPGSAPGRPIVLGSASQIEPRFERDACTRCGGRLHVDEHAVRVVDDARYRVVTGTCGTCGASRTAWFLLASADDEADSTAAPN